MSAVKISKGYKQFLVAVLLLLVVKQIYFLFAARFSFVPVLFLFLEITALAIVFTDNQQIKFIIKLLFGLIVLQSCASLFSAIQLYPTYGQKMLFSGIEAIVSLVVGIYILFNANKYIKVPKAAKHTATKKSEPTLAKEAEPIITNEAKPIVTKEKISASEPMQLSLKAKQKSNSMAVACIAFLIIHIIFFELSCQIQYNKSSIVVFSVWLIDGDKTIPLFIAWAILLLCAMAFFGLVINSAYKAATGKPSAYLYVGNKLGEGDFIYPENNQTGEPLYIPHTNIQDEFFGDSFSSLYKRKIYLKDGEGTLTDSRELMPGRMVVIILAASALILFAFAFAGKLVPTQFGEISGNTFTTVNSSNHAASNSFPQMERLYIGIAILFLVIFIGSLAIVSSKMAGFNHDEKKLLPLPKIIFEGAILSGKVVDKQSNHKTSTNIKRARFYRGFSIKFDAKAGFEIPVYISWVERKYLNRDISIAHGELKKDRKTDKELNDKLFALLEDAMNSGEYFKFKVDTDLFITPIQHD